MENLVTALEIMEFLVLLADSTSTNRGATLVRCDTGDETRERCRAIADLSVYIARHVSGPAVIQKWAKTK